MNADKSKSVYLGSESPTRPEGPGKMRSHQNSAVLRRRVENGFIVETFERTSSALLKFRSAFRRTMDLRLWG